MKKLLILGLILAVSLALPLKVFGDQYGNVYHEIQVYDELGRKVTGISAVDIYLPGTTTHATIYKERNKTSAITQQITTTSTNTTLADGSFYWWGPDGWDFTISDGTDTFSSGGRSLSSSEGKIIFPLYLKDISSTSYEDDESITLGTSSDWVINAGTTEDLLTFTPATDGAVFRVGLANGTKCADLQWYTASGVGLLIDEGANTFAITGLTTSINASSNYDTNINTGTSTGAVNIGSSTSGAVAMDTTSTFSINADGQLSLTTTDAGADIVATSTAGRFIVFAGEDAADAVLVEADGSTASTIRVFNDTGTSASSIEFDTDVGGIYGHADAGPVAFTATGSTAGDMTLTAGDDMTLTATGTITVVSTETAANGIYVHANGGTSEAVKVHSDQGTGAASVYLLSDAGGITATASAGLVALNALGASAGDMTLTAGDDFLVTATGKADITSAESTTITAPAINMVGPVDLQTTYCIFHSTPVTCQNDGTVTDGTTGATNAMAVDGYSFEYFILGAGQTITTPVVTANGLNVRLDAADDEGLELGQGITANSKSAFTIGTDAFYLKVKFYISDVNQLDICAIGFRLTEAYNADLYAYNTYAGINVNNGTINGIDELNGASAHETGLDETWANGATHTLEIRISSGKAVTQYLDGVAVSTPLVFSWTDVDTVVPFFTVLGDATAACEVSLQSWECGLQ